MNWVSKAALGLAGLCLCILPGGVLAQEQQQGLCADVEIVISQQLTLERVGFLATLQITCNDANNPITGFSANLTFENLSLSTNGVVNDSSSLFFVQPPTLQNVTNVSGAGVIGPGETQTKTFEMKSGTQAIGIVALYRDIDHATWRADAPVADSGPTKLTLTISKLAVKLAPTPPPK